MALLCRLFRSVPSNVNCHSGIMQGKVANIAIKLILRSESCSHTFVELHVILTIGYFKHVLDLNSW